MHKKMCKARKSKKRHIRSSLSQKGCFGNQNSSGSYETKYPKGAKGISFWKIPGWREETKTKKGVIM
jgi:hypothetical protein